MRLDLAALHDRILSGDREAECELYKWLHDNKYLFAGSCLYMAEDIASHTHIQLIQLIRAGKVRVPRALFSVADIIALRYRRTLHRRNRIYIDRDPELDTNSFVPDETPLVVESIRLDDMKRQLNRAIRELPLERAEIIRRYYYEEQSQEQIMAELKITPTQFRLHKSRALAKLRKHVGVVRKKQNYKRKANDDNHNPND